MAGIERTRRWIAVVLVAVLIIISSLNFSQNTASEPGNQESPAILSSTNELALSVLNKIEIKGRAPQTNYSREQFGGDWSENNGCDTRNIILFRDLKDARVDDKCNVTNGVLDDPYTAKTIIFVRGSGTSGDVQIDHVVALSDAWQKGAKQLTREERVIFANDPLELLAVDGPANLQKSGSDAASWFPPNKAFRCQYVARQVAVKFKYKLWVTNAESDAIRNILMGCPTQTVPN